MTPEAELVAALITGKPVPADLVKLCSVEELAAMVLTAIRSEAVEVWARLHVPESVEEFEPGWVAEPVAEPGTTPPVVYALAIARGEVAEHLAETVDRLALAQFVVLVSEWPRYADPVVPLEVYQASEWDRLEAWHRQHRQQHGTAS